MNIPCSMILDLLPTYIEGLCSEETAALVEEHLAQCEDCRKACEALKAPMEVDTVSKKETISVPNPFRKIKKKHLRNVLLTIFCTAALVLAPFLADQIPFVRDFFHPVQRAGIRIEEENSGWHSLSFDGGYLVYDSPFYQREIISDHNNEINIQFRVKDEQGNIVVEPFYLEPGRSYRPTALEKDTKYQVEVNVKIAGSFFFAFA